MASTWKQVLTSDDVTNINLSNTDLTQNADLIRKFNIGEANGGAKTLEIQADYANSGAEIPVAEFHRTESGQVQLYLSAFDGVWVGNRTASAGSKYQLPPLNTCGAGKLITGTSVSAAEFTTLDDWLNPDGTGDGFSSTSGFAADGSEPRLDKVLVWDNNESRYEPCSLQELSKAMGRTYTMTFGRGQPVTTLGSAQMRTTNGAEGTGYVVPFGSRVLGISYGGNFSSTDGSGSIRVLLKINGTTFFNLSGQSYATYNQTDMLTDITDGVKRNYKQFPTPLLCPANTRIDTVVQYNGDNTGSVDDQSILVFLDTYDFPFDLPITI